MLFSAESTFANFLADAFAIFELDWNSMFTSASGRCSLRIVPSGSGMPWSHIIMSCWIIPSHLGSGYFPEPFGSSIPCSFAR